MLGFAKMTPVPRSHASQDVFHAIADGNRRVLIDLMEPGPRAVGELVVASGMSYSATSQHLAILRRAGLVSSEASGRRRIYQLRPAALREVYDWSGRYSEFWQGRLDALGHLLGEQP
jgi:DNA-binding transcriptional ArsR family regulator